MSPRLTATFHLSFHDTFHQKSLNKDLRVFKHVFLTLCTRYLLAKESFVHFGLKTCKVEKERVQKTSDNAFQSPAIGLLHRRLAEHHVQSLLRLQQRAVAAKGRSLLGVQAAVLDHAEFRASRNAKNAHEKLVSDSRSGLLRFVHFARMVPIHGT